MQEQKWVYITRISLQGEKKLRKKRLGEKLGLNKEELKKYTWNKTSEETIDFIMDTLKRYNDI